MPVYKYVRKINELTGISVTDGFRDQRKSNPEHGSPGEQLRKKRQALGLSQEEMAEKLGVSVDYIADLENGRNKREGKNQRLRDFLNPAAMEKSHSLI